MNEIFVFRKFVNKQVSNNFLENVHKCFFSLFPCGLSAYLTHIMNVAYLFIEALEMTSMVLVVYNNLKKYEYLNYSRSSFM
jgi:hypothetical protein